MLGSTLNCLKVILRSPELDIKFLMTCFDVFWRLLVFEVAKSVTCPMFKVWVKKIENFIFVSYDLKMILNGFWTCFGDFWFSRSPNPFHD